MYPVISRQHIPYAHSLIFSYYDFSKEILLHKDSYFFTFVSVEKNIILVDFSKVRMSTLTHAAEIWALAVVSRTEELRDDQYRQFNLSQIY